MGHPSAKCAQVCCRFKFVLTGLTHYNAKQLLWSAACAIVKKSGQECTAFECAFVI
jgi:hypothetical protein